MNIFCAVAEEMTRYRSSHILEKKPGKEVSGGEGSVRETGR